MAPRQDPSAPGSHRVVWAEESLGVAILTGLAWVFLYPFVLARYRLRGGVRRLFAERFRIRYPERAVLGVQLRRVPRRPIVEAEILDSEGERHRLAYNRVDEVMAWD